MAASRMCNTPQQPITSLSSESENYFLEIIESLGLQRMNSYSDRAFRFK